MPRGRKKKAKVEESEENQEEEKTDIETEAAEQEDKSYEEEKKKVDEVAGANSEIIELSDIAIGITPEDDAIVELTEEVIGEALDGFAGAVREIMKEGEEILDLSEDNIEKGESDQAL